jgi:pentatricopeptide repeat protein
MNSIEMKFANGELETGPNTFAYNILIHCWTKSNRKDAAEQALNILEDMISRYRGGFDPIRPDKISYSSVMDALAKSGDVMRCQKIFDMMERDYKEGNKSAKPDIVAYNTLVHAWSNSGMEDAPDQAQKVLDIVEMKFVSGELEEGSNVVTYNTLIGCWAKSKRKDAAEQALNILQGMLSR